MTAAAAARSASIRSSTSTRVDVARREPEVVAAERVFVMVLVAQEVDVLERRAEAAGAVDQIGGRASVGMRRARRSRRPGGTSGPTTSADP